MCCIYFNSNFIIFPSKSSFRVFLEKLEGDSKSNQEKIDERNISVRNIEPGNIEPFTEGTVMIVRSHNQMK